jgi:hypothetical protein
MNEPVKGLLTFSVDASPTRIRSSPKPSRLLSVTAPPPTASELDFYCVTKLSNLTNFSGLSASPAESHCFTNKSE